MKYIRRLTAPLSAVLLILIAALAFMNLRTGTEYPPPILDPEFGLWVSDPGFGSRRPMVWELEYERGYYDQITLRESVVEDKTALQIEIYQDGADGRWAYIRLGQGIDGSRLRALFDKKVEIWVFKDPVYASRSLPSDTAGCLFEVEINDGIHALEFIFGEIDGWIDRSPTHRTVFLQTPAAEWTHHLIDIVGQYREAGWRLPDRISLSIIFGAPGSATGWHGASVHAFSVAKTTSANPTQQAVAVVLKDNMWTLCATNQSLLPSDDLRLLNMRWGYWDFTRV